LLLIIPYSFADTHLSYARPKAKKRQTGPNWAET